MSLTQWLVAVGLENAATIIDQVITKVVLTSVLS